MSISRHKENRGTLVTSLPISKDSEGEEMSQKEWKFPFKQVADCIDQEIMNMIAEKSKNVSIEDAREALQEREAREREAALDRLAEMDAELMDEILKDDE